MLTRLLRRRIGEVDPDAPWQSEADGELAPIPCQAVVLFPKPPLVTWLRSLKDSEGSPSFEDATLDMVRSDLTAYLIPPGLQHEVDDARGFVDQHYRRFFAQELSQWLLNRAQWPEPRTLNLFHQWYEVKVYPMVLDTVE